MKKYQIELIEKLEMRMKYICEMYDNHDSEIWYSNVATSEVITLGDMLSYVEINYSDNIASECKMIQELALLYRISDDNDVKTMCVNEINNINYKIAIKSKFLEKLYWFTVSRIKKNACKNKKNYFTR